MNLLEVGYLALTFLTLVFLIKIGLTARSSDVKTSKKNIATLTLGLAFWQFFIYILSLSGFNASLKFPPRFALTFIIPSFIFTGAFLYFHRNRQWLLRIPIQWIVYFQTFRVLVETLFALSVARGILHSEVTIYGYNFDMLFAFTAPLVAYLVSTKKILTLQFLVRWNYLGLAVIASIIFLFITTIYRPEWYGSQNPLLPLEALEYPYVLIAGFLMPVAVFLHVLSILQVRALKGNPLNKRD